MKNSKWVSSYDQTRLHYTVGGTGKPTFLLFDGIGCDGFIWPYLRPYLEEIGTVIHLHMRGHGESAEPAQSTHIEITHLAQDWEALFNQENKWKPVVLNKQQLFNLQNQHFYSHSTNPTKTDD